jgi:hypothetical protein
VPSQEELDKDERGDESKLKPAIIPIILSEELPVDSGIISGMEPTIGAV